MLELTPMLMPGLRLKLKLMLMLKIMLVLVRMLGLMLRLGLIVKLMLKPMQKTVRVRTPKLMLTPESKLRPRRMIERAM